MAWALALARSIADVPRSYGGGPYPGLVFAVGRIPLQRDGEVSPCDGKCIDADWDGVVADPC